MTDAIGRSVRLFLVEGKSTGLITQAEQTTPAPSPASTSPGIRATAEQPRAPGHGAPDG